jgi:hypothetical protein
MVFNKRRRSLRTNSIAATDDYIKHCLLERDYVVKNVPMETLQQFSSWRNIPTFRIYKDVIETINKRFCFILKY